MDIAVIRVPAEEIQPSPIYRRDTDYLAHASNLKRARTPGRILGTFNLLIPSLELFLWCAWARNDHGDEFVAMPKTVVTTPSGAAHRKTLVRWTTATAEQRFQRIALRALHRLIANTEGRCP